MGSREPHGGTLQHKYLHQPALLGLFFLTSLTACAGQSGTLVAAPTPAHWADGSIPGEKPPVIVASYNAPVPQALSLPQAIDEAETGQSAAFGEPSIIKVTDEVSAAPTASPAPLTDTPPTAGTDAQIAKLQEALQAQQRALAAQQKQIEALQDQLNAVRTAAANASEQKKLADAADREARAAEHKRALKTARAAAGFAVASTTASPPLLTSRDIADANEATGATDRETVGEKPEDKQVVPDLPTIADQGGVLTPKHTLTLEPSVTASHSSRSRFLFKGIEIIPSVLVGAINVNQVQHDYVSGALAARYGITDRLEGFVTIPYVYRHDILDETSLIAGSTGGKDRRSLSGEGIGDIDFGLQYQLTRGSDRWPILTTNIRAKSDTGRGPFDVPFDSDGIGTKLATGSGFWSVQPSLTAITTMDPLVFYGSVSYLKNFGRNVNKVVPVNGSTARIGQVDPGDALGFSFGGAFAITDNVSVSLGYEHYYVFQTSTEQSTLDSGTGLFGPVSKQKGEVAQLGSLLFGANFRTRSGGAFNVTLAAGLTDDAPDVQLTIRRPFSMDLSR